MTWNGIIWLRIGCTEVLSYKHDTEHSGLTLYRALVQLYHTSVFLPLYKYYTQFYVTQGPLNLKYFFACVT
jgi:hypothetical protein